MRYCPNLAGVRSILPCSGLIHETVRYIKLGCHQLMVTDGSIGFSESTAPSTRPCPVFSQWSSWEYKKSNLLLQHKFCKWWLLICMYLFHAGNRTFSKSRLKPCYQFSVVLRFASDLLCDKGKNRLFSLPVPVAIQKNRYLQKILNQEALWSFQQKFPQGGDLENYCWKIL